MSDNDLECVESCERFSKKARKKSRKMDCAELLEQILELTERERPGRVGTKGLIQRFRDYLGDDETHGKTILDQQRSLRTYIDEYISRGCGDPPGRSVEISERELLKVAAGVGLAYLAYRAIRMLPSLLPPLWPTIPANLAIP